MREIDEKKYSEELSIQMRLRNSTYYEWELGNAGEFFCR